MLVLINLLRQTLDLLARFPEVFPDTEVAYICGDREFVGREWLTYLLIEPRIPFRIRIRETDRILESTHFTDAQRLSKLLALINKFL